MKLLIVDDSAIIRRSINSAYEGTVFTDIQTATDGLLALSIFKKQQPDVVTLDITMPHMDGLAALSQIMELKPNTTVLVISALADHHTAIEALIRGANQFICKPFSSTELKDALDTLLEEREKAKSKIKRNEKEKHHLNTNEQIEATPAPIKSNHQPVISMYPSADLTQGSEAVKKQRRITPDSFS